MLADVFSLEGRVTVLDGSGGGGGCDNSSLVELEIRVTELEAITAELGSDVDNHDENILVNTEAIQGESTLLTDR